MASRWLHAFACSVWPSVRRSRNPTNARAASRAARDFRIPKPTPFKTLWLWSPRRSFTKSASGAFDVLDRRLRAVLQSPFLVNALFVARLLVTSAYRVMALAGIWTSSVGRVAQTGLEWTIIQFRDPDWREIRYLLLYYNEPLRQSANIESPLGAPHGIVTLKH